MISTILLNFGTELGMNRAININNANGAVTGPTVRGAMSDMIDTQFAVGRSGRITSRRSAFLTQRSATPVIMPE